MEDGGGKRRVEVSLGWGVEREETGNGTALHDFSVRCRCGCWPGMWFCRTQMVWASWSWGLWDVVFLVVDGHGRGCNSERCCVWAGLGWGIPQSRSRVWLQHACPVGVWGSRHLGCREGLSRMKRGVETNTWASLYQILKSRSSGRTGESRGSRVITRANSRLLSLVVNT